MVATKIGLDPLQFRLKNAVKAGSPTVWGPKHAHDGFGETIQAIQRHPGYGVPLAKNQGRGASSLSIADSAVPVLSKRG